KDEETNENESRSVEDLVFELQQILSDDIINHLNQMTLIQLLQMDDQVRDEGKDLIAEAVAKELDKGVRMENMETAKEEAKAAIQMAKFPKNVSDTFIKITGFLIVENSFFDMEKTMQARNEAASNVDPVMIRAGDIIVNEGQIITNEVYEELKL